MKKIVVPEGMLKAAYELKFDFHPMTAQSPEYMKLCSEIIEAALFWLSDNPQVPTDEQCDEIVRLSLKRTVDRCVPLPATGAVRDALMEWQRRCFVAVEPEISATAKTIGQKMMGVTFSAADADYLINEVILATTPRYVPPMYAKTFTKEEVDSPRFGEPEIPAEIEDLLLDGADFIHGQKAADEANKVVIEAYRRGLRKGEK